jgi:hypothetical protein
MEKPTNDTGEIIQKLPSEPIHKASFKNLASLDLNDPTRYRLLDLDQLDTKDYRNVYMNITYLDVSRNSISSLKLKGYMLLETIVACDNSITRVELNLPRLKKLNLSDNMITRIFELNNIPLLEELILNKNSTKNIVFEEFKPVKNTLTVLELAQNRVDFPSVKDFLDCFEQFGKYMKKLKTLNLSNNSFNGPNNKIYREYADYIIFHCLTLKIMNGKMIDNNYRLELRVGSLKAKLLENEKDAGPKIINNVADRGAEFKYKGQISLSIINKELENYSQMGKLNKTTFKELKKILELYFMSSAGEQSKDESNKLEDCELDEFETMLEYCNILTDASPSIEKLFFEVVAQFVPIKNGKFANRALAFLQNRLSPEKIMDTEEVIDQFIIKPMCEGNLEDISAVIIKGLEPFLKEYKFVSCFMKLVEKLIQVVKAYTKIKIINTKSFEENSKKDCYLASASFLSIASQNNEHLQLMLNNDEFISAITFRIKNLLNEGDEVISTDSKVMEILQKLLFLVRSMCMINLPEGTKHASINKLVGSGLRDKIEENLNNKLQDMASKKETDSKAEGGLKELLYSRKLIFANLMRCYGSLLYRTESITKLIENKQSIPMKIFNLLVQSDMNDPIVISSACDFALYFLNNKQMKLNTDSIFDKATKSLYNLRFVLPYLFQEKKEYKAACFLADTYGENTLVRGKPLPMFQLNSEIINTLIISIANLIEFFGHNSKKESKIKKACLEICREINEQNGDTALCHCLVLSSEKVKLAIVECFYSWHSEFLDAGEINLILKQLSNINLTGGLIDKIVSIIFIVLNRSFIYNLTRGKLDVVEQNKEAIFFAFDIILKNEERNAVHEIENLQKAMLSLSIVNFLYNCSCFESMKNIFQEPRNSYKLCKILYYEEFFREKSFSLPVEIEKTKTGSNLMIIFDCMKSESFSLRPYTYVSLRIMIHMADILMGIPFPICELPENEGFNEIIAHLRKEVVKNECFRIKMESQTFRKFVDVKIENAERFPYNIELSKDEQKEQQIVFLKNFNMILKYILGENSQKTITHFSQIFKDKFDPDMDNVKYTTKFVKEPKEENFFSGKINDEDNLYEVFKGYLREEEYYPLGREKESSTEYEYIMNDLIKYFKYGQEDFGLKRTEEDETPDNPYIRSLFIAAFLRAIYALLEFPVEQSIKDEMIRTLYAQDNITKISKLVDCTKLLDNNISSKYLIIIRHVLSNSKFYFENNLNEDADFIYINIVGTICYVLGKMIRIFKRELKLDFEDHKVFLAEVARLIAIISNEVISLNFDNPSNKEKTFEKMIGFELINLFIQIIKESMNREALSYKLRMESEEEDKNSEDVLMSEMVLTMSYIIGEYMSKVKKNSYSILEQFTRSYIFEKVKLRKFYLKEIMYYSKQSDLKTKISYELNTKVDFISRVYITDYHQESSKLKLMILTNAGLEFIDVNNPEDERSDWQLQKFELNKKMKIPYGDIDAIIWFELKNRILIKTSNNYYGLFFYKTHTGSLLLPVLKSANGKFILYENIPLFVDEEKMNNLNLEKETPEIKIKNEDNEEKNLNDEETPGDTLDTPDTPAEPANVEENKEEELSEENKSQIQPQGKETVVILCVATIKQFFDFITKMFEKSQLIKEGKVFVFQKDKLKIYQEDSDEWTQINVKLIFEKAMKSIKTKGIYLGDFSRCYKYITEYELPQLKDFAIGSVDQVILSFNSGDPIQLTILDDISYVRMKAAIFPFIKLNQLPVKDDFYEDIK